METIRGQFEFLKLTNFVSAKKLVKIVLRNKINLKILKRS